MAMVMVAVLGFAATALAKGGPRSYVAKIGAFNVDIRTYISVPGVQLWAADQISTFGAGKLTMIFPDKASWDRYKKSPNPSPETLLDWLKNDFAANGNRLKAAKEGYHLWIPFEVGNTKRLKAETGAPDKERVAAAETRILLAFNGHTDTMNDAGPPILLAQTDKKKPVPVQPIPGGGQQTPQAGVGGAADPTMEAFPWFHPVVLKTMPPTGAETARTYVAVKEIDGIPFRIGYWGAPGMWWISKKPSVQKWYPPKDPEVNQTPVYNILLSSAEMAWVVIKNPGLTDALGSLKKKLDKMTPAPASVGEQAWYDLQEVMPGVLY